MQEAEELRIGHYQKECEERTRRMFNNLILETEVIRRYLDGETIIQISNEIREFSKSKIERLLKDYAKQKKQERNRNIFFLAQQNKTVAEIARLCECSKPTVRAVLNGKKPSDFVIIDRIKESSELSLTTDTDNLECLYSLHKLKTKKATVDDYSQALLTLQTSKRNIFITGSAGCGKSNLINDYFFYIISVRRIQSIMNFKEMNDYGIKQQLGSRN